MRMMYALNLILLATLAAAAFVVYTKVIDPPAHTDPSIPIPYSTREGKTMLAVVSEVSSPRQKKSARAGIPPIDAAAPAKIETATFALG